MTDCYLDEWTPERARRAEEGTDRLLGRHPVWGESVDGLGPVRIVPKTESWRVKREALAARMQSNLVMFPKAVTRG